MLTAEEVNTLFELAGKVSRMMPGAFMSGAHGNTGIFQNAPAPWVQHTVEISSDELLYEDHYSGMYNCKIRYYDHSVRKWRSSSNEWLLDASDFSMMLLDNFYFSYLEQHQVRSGLLMQNDRIAAWWDRQRGAFVPYSVPTTIRWAKLETDLYAYRYGSLFYPYYGSALAKIWTRTSVPTSTNPDMYIPGSWVGAFEETDVRVVVYSPPFMGADESIKSGQFIAISNMQSEYIWYVIGAPGEVLTECSPI